MRSKGQTVYLRNSRPLLVLSIEKRPSRTTTLLSGKQVQLREARTHGGCRDWIPEDMILRVEDRR